MTYHTIIRPEAEQDLQNAFTWYQEARLGLGYDVLLQVEAGLQFIERNPDAHPSEYKGTRKHVIKRFPYKIMYRVEIDHIIILAVIHGSRNPTVSKRRADHP
ncbi:MAG: type II toxin-antitoxin system RelE/ParE family toxin [Nitrospira sp.]